jgi:lysine 2,3-aminomutase
MKEKLTPYLKNLSGLPAIAAQYLATTAEPNACDLEYDDPLLEDEHEVVKGLVHKYPNRALIKVSYQCAAHCRFCTRIRQIGTNAGNLTATDVSSIMEYLTRHPEIDDVILSGGDPLYSPGITTQLLEQLRHIPSVNVLRIGTRLPLQLPGAFQRNTIKELLSLIDETGKKKPFFILLHVNHPDELTTEAMDVIKLLRQLRVTLLSQTVFLKGINDEYDVLHDLYTRLYHAGVIPYYLYHCDDVNGIGHFAGDIAKETAIATRLTATLSGIACPTYIIDIKNGHGKIPVPLNFISDRKNTIDFNGKMHEYH